MFLSSSTPAILSFSSELTLSLSFFSLSLYLFHLAFSSSTSSILLIPHLHPYFSIAFSPSSCGTLFTASPQLHLSPTLARFTCPPHPPTFILFFFPQQPPQPIIPPNPQPQSSYPGLGSPCPCLSSSLPSPLLCLPQPQPSAQCSRGEPARNAVALDVLSKP